MMKRKWSKLAALMAATGLAAVACGSQVAGTKNNAVPAAKPQAVVKSVEVEEKDGAVVVRVKTDRKVTYSLYQQKDPLRLVLDLPRTTTGDIERHLPVNSGTVSFIRPVTTDRGDSRLELLLTAESLYEINGKGNLARLVTFLFQEVLPRYVIDQIRQLTSRQSASMIGEDPQSENQYPCTCHGWLIVPNRGGEKP